MQNAKKINVSYSSLVGLKAELLRKQAEVQEAKAQNKTQSPIILKPKLKKNKTSKNASSVDKQSSKTKTSKVTEIEDVNDLKKSRYMLEAKSKLYEKLKRTCGDKSHNYLVDFSHKPISSASSSSSEDEIFNKEDYDRNSDPEDDWVEYSDCFGRTRTCLRRDLPKMQEKDAMIKQEISKDPPNVTETPPNFPFITPQKEPEIEKLRKKWEEQTEKLSHKPDIHYQDILFDEARAHGVGYYAFSQDEDERLKQQENLSKLRKETEQRQRETQNVNELKAQMEKNRLKAARIRQRIRAGLPAESDEEEEVPKPSPQSSEIPEPTEDPVDEKNEENSLCIIEDKIKAFGELLGKRPKFRELSQEEWVHKRRKDRLGEFAPVYENFKPGGLLKATGDDQIVEADDDEDPMRIPIRGPDPTDLWESQGPDKSFQDVNNSDEKDEFEDSGVIGPLPPPNLNNSENSSLITNPIPPFACGNLLPNSCNGSSVTIIPPIEVLRAVPPPTFQSSFHVYNEETRSVQRNDGGAAHERDGDEPEESDDSEIIGPLPSRDNSENPNLANIPLPGGPPPSRQTPQSNLNLDNISEGLKFLRKKFDKCEKS